MSMITWKHSLDDGIAAARKLAKPIFLDIWAHGCVGCQKMDAITYPEPDIVELLNSEFVGVKLNTRDQVEDVRRFAMVWTPRLLVLTQHGEIVRDITGFLPSKALLAELGLGHGIAELRSARFPQAKIDFERIEAASISDESVAEALYWKGVATYRLGQGEKEPLFEIWREIVSRFPGTIWATKTTLLPEHALPSSVRHFIRAV
jgi:hypothetical protein